MSMNQFPDRKYLIDTQELRERIGSVTLIDLRPAEDFALGHIEGSRHLDLYGVSLNDSAEAPLNAFLAIFPVLFGARGVSRDTPVVIYDHESGERASRAVWLLAVLGHPDVRILDGGTAAWMASGYPLVRLTDAAMPVDPAKAPPTRHPSRRNSISVCWRPVSTSTARSAMPVPSSSTSGVNRSTAAPRSGPAAREPSPAPSMHSGGTTWTTAAHFVRQARSAAATLRRASRRTRT